MNINNMMRTMIVGGAVLVAFSALPASAATFNHHLQLNVAVFDDDATPAADPAPTDPAPDPAPESQSN